MKHAALTHLLLLLVAFAAFDDFCAAATSDAADDLAAAEDNEYVASTCSPAEDPRGVSTSPPPCLPAADCGICESPVGAGAVPRDVGVPTDLSPLYVFTSMRC
jgi:hypothetical protein